MGIRVCRTNPKAYACQSLPKYQIWTSVDSLAACAWGKILRANLNKVCFYKHFLGKMVVTITNGRISLPACLLSLSSEKVCGFIQFFNKSFTFFFSWWSLLVVLFVVVWANKVQPSTRTKQHDKICRQSNILTDTQSASWTGAPLACPDPRLCQTALTPQCMAGRHSRQRTARRLTNGPLIPFLSPSRRVFHRQEEGFLWGAWWFPMQYSKLSTKGRFSVGGYTALVQLTRRRWAYWIRRCMVEDCRV